MQVIVALVYPDSGFILLVGPTGDLFKRIDIWYLIDVQWSPDGCQLWITTGGPSGITLSSIDLVGETQQDLLLESSTVDQNINYPRLSPDGQWITYVAGFREEKGVYLRDIRVIDVDEPARPFYLTERGGAGICGGVWSPDGQRLAYSDYDQDGNGQLYLSRPDGSDRRQLTHFTMPKTTMDVIQWSPDGQKLAFNVYDQEDNSQGIWTVRSDGSDLCAMTVDDDNLARGTLRWWSADSRTLVAYARGGKLGAGLYWYNSGTGKPYHVFYESQAPGTIVGPFPIFDIQTIGFMGGDGNFYAYDMDSSTYKLWLHRLTLFPDGEWPLLRQVVPVPGGVVDISQCPSK